MTTTTFVNGVTLTDAAWFNDVDALIYDIFNQKTSAGTSGTILRSNGTNIVNTTATYPTTTTSGRVVYSSAANTIGESAANFTYDGTTVTVTAEVISTSITVPNTGLLIKDTDASHNLTIKPGSNITADRIFTLTTGDAARTLNISAADVTISSFGATVVDDADQATAQATLGLVIGTNVQAFDSDLAALAANSTDGVWCHTGAGTGAARTLTAPAAGFTITNPAGIAGNPTFVLADDLNGLEGLATTGLATRTAASTWVTRAVTGTASQITVTNGDGVAGAPTISFPADVLIPTILTVPNSGLHVLDTNASHDLVITPGSDLTADRILTLTTGDAARTYTYSRDSGTPTIGTPTATTSGTSVDITGIPTWATRIDVTFAGISTNGTSSIIVQLGDSGGPENTGYNGSVSTIVTPSTVSTAALSSGFMVVPSVAAGTTASGILTLILLSSASNTWAGSWILGNSDTQRTSHGAGDKATSATVDRIRLTTAGGTDTFDAGTINIVYS